MGLLDDAIREHLELKRKHGADPEDVARQEREALGPGQRNEFAQPDAALADVATPADEPATTVMSPEPASEPQPEPEPAAEPEPERSRRPSPRRPRTPCPTAGRAGSLFPRSRRPSIRRPPPATTRTRGSTTSPTRSPPTKRSSPAPLRPPARRTCSRRRRSSSRRRPSTTACGSSRSRPGTSTGTSSGGEGNRTPTSAVQRPRAPIITTPPEPPLSLGPRRVRRRSRPWRG